MKDTGSRIPRLTTAGTPTEAPTRNAIEPTARRRGVAAIAPALLLALLAVLVPRWGMIGAATSSLAGIATLNLGMTAIVWRKTGLKCWARPASFAGFASQMARAR